MRCSASEVALPFGGRRDPDLHLPNRSQRRGQDRDPVQANEADERGKHMAVRVLPDREGVVGQRSRLKEPHTQNEGLRNRKPKIPGSGI